MGKVLALEPLCSELETLSDKKIVFTNGCFDLLHIGHVRYLNEAKSCGEILIVGVNSDASVKALKGETRPIQSEADRAEILSNLISVDYVVIFSDQTPIKLIKSISPDVLVKGGDWDVKTIVGYDHVHSTGGEVHSLKYIDGRSTTNLIKKANF